MFILKEQDLLRDPSPELEWVREARYPGRTSYTHDIPADMLVRFVQYISLHLESNIGAIAVQTGEIIRGLSREFRIYDELANTPVPAAAAGSRDAFHASFKKLTSSRGPNRESF